MISFEIFLLIFLLLATISVMTTKDLVSATIIFTSYSLIMSLIWIIVEAPDVGITEAASGAGASSILFYLAINRVNQLDSLDSHWEDKNNIVTRFMRLVKNSFDPKHAPIEASHPPRTKKSQSLGRRVYQFAGIAFSLIFISLLLATIPASPLYGNPDVPAMNEVALRYVEQGPLETGAVNTVAGMIMDYRAFDTLGEAMMIFVTAYLTIMLVRSVLQEEEA